jgi:hypothetical protein
VLLMKSGMLRRVALVRTDVSEELSTSIIGVTRIVELGMLAITSVLTRAIRRNIPEDTILHSHHRENLKSYSVADILEMHGARTLSVRVGGVHECLRTYIGYETELSPLTHMGHPHPISPVILWKYVS